ncbi:hypothetical protein [Lederbergia citrea]|uniref:hypothetical protein n=1 Tax=Lederbergia citrea TaxID=2833581 RepID=UPI001BCA3F6D|nr:hypothetical protein [Lederbergia citrea]MBS4178154.1 hypothetical protein [Lederbergia citrea]
MHSKKGTVVIISAVAFVIAFIIGGNFYWEKHLSENVKHTKLKTFSLHKRKSISANTLLKQEVPDEFDDDNAEIEDPVDEEDSIEIEGMDGRLEELTAEPITEQTSTREVNSQRPISQRNNQSISNPRSSKQKEEREGKGASKDKKGSTHRSGETNEPDNPPRRPTPPEEPTPPVTEEKTDLQEPKEPETRDPVGSEIPEEPEEVGNPDNPENQIEQEE